MSNMPSLVPQDLLSEQEDTDYESRRLLEVLAKQVADATKELVTGEVRTSYPNRAVEHEFSLRGTDSGYRYDFFWLIHGLDEFPVHVRGPWGSSHDLVRCETLDELQDHLRAVFSDVRTKRLINQLAKLDV